MPKQYDLKRIEFSLKDAEMKKLISKFIDSIKEAGKERSEARRRDSLSKRPLIWRLAHRDAPELTQEALLSLFGIKEGEDDRLAVEFSYVSVFLNPVQAHLLEGYWQFLNNHFPEFNIYNRHYTPVKAPRLLAIELLQRLATLILSSNHWDEAGLLCRSYFNFQNKIRGMGILDKSSLFTIFNENRKKLNVFYFEKWSDTFSSYESQIDSVRYHRYNIDLVSVKLANCEEYLRQRIILELKPNDGSFLKIHSRHKAQHLAEQDYIKKSSPTEGQKQADDLFSPFEFLSLVSDQEAVLEGYKHNNPRASFFSSDKTLEQEGILHLQEAYQLLEETRRYQALNQRLGLLIEGGDMLPWFSECIDLRGWIGKVSSHMSACEEFVWLDDKAWLKQQSAAKYRKLWGFCSRDSFSNSSSYFSWNKEEFKLILTQNPTYALKVKEARECAASLSVDLISNKVATLFDELFPEGVQPNRQAGSLSSSSSAFFARRSSGSVSYGGGAAAEVGKSFF